MMANIFLGRDAFIDFSVHVTGIVLIIPALFWLFFGEREFANRSRAEKEDRNISTRIFFWLILIPLGLLIAPGTSSIIQKTIGSQPYIDTMIAIPTALIAVCAFMHLIDTLHLVGKKKTGAVICFSLLIMTSSSVFMTYDHPLGIELISNSKKISPEVIEICDHLGSDYSLLPEEIYGQIHEYDSDVKAGILAGVTNDYDYAANVVKSATDAQATYFVIRKTYDDPIIAESNYYKVAETDHYLIYQRSKE